MQACIGKAPTIIVSEETLAKCQVLEELVETQVLSEEGFYNAINKLGVRWGDVEYIAIGQDVDSPIVIINDEVAQNIPPGGGGDGPKDHPYDQGGSDPSGGNGPPEGDNPPSGAQGPSRLYDPEIEAKVGDPGTVEFRQLFRLVASPFPNSVPAGIVPPPPPFLMENNQNASAPQAQEPCRFALYDGVVRLRDDLATACSNVTKEGKKPSAVFHRRKKSYRVMGDQSFPIPPVINDTALGRISKAKPSTTASALIPLEELRKLESDLIGLQETQSFSFWLVSTLISYVNTNGFVAPDPALFARLTSSLSLSLVDQAKAAHAMSAFCTLTRRDHYLKFAQPTVTDGQKSKLRSGNPFKPDLFDPPTLEQVVQEYEGASLTSSHLTMASAVVRGMYSGKRKWTPPGAPSTSSAGAGASRSPLLINVTLG